MLRTLTACVFLLSMPPSVALIVGPPNAVVRGNRGRNEGQKKEVRGMSGEDTS
jgi:hypothetical protein